MKNYKEKGKHTEHQISNRTEWNLQKNDIVDWVTTIKKPVPVNGTMFGNHVLEDATKLSSYWIRVGSKSDGWNLSKTIWKWIQMHREIVMWWLRQWLEWCVIAQGTPRITTNHHSLGRGQEGVLPGSFRGSVVLLALIADAELPSCDWIVSTK